MKIVRIIAAWVLFSTTLSMYAQLKSEFLFKIPNDQQRAQFNTALRFMPEYSADLLYLMDDTGKVLRNAAFGIAHWEGMGKEVSLEQLQHRIGIYIRGEDKIWMPNIIMYICWPNLLRGIAEEDFSQKLLKEFISAFNISEELILKDKSFCKIDMQKMQEITDKADTTSPENATKLLRTKTAEAVEAFIQERFPTLTPYHKRALNMNFVFAVTPSRHLMDLQNKLGMQNVPISLVYNINVTVDDYRTSTQRDLGEFYTIISPLKGQALKSTVYNFLAKLGVTEIIEYPHTNLIDYVLSAKPINEQGTLIKIPGAVVTQPQEVAVTAEAKYKRGQESPALQKRKEWFKNLFPPLKK